MKEKGKNFTGLQTFWSDIAVIMVLSFVLIIAFLATETGLKGQCHTICCLFRKVKTFLCINCNPIIIVQFSYLRLHLGIETNGKGGRELKLEKTGLTVEHLTAEQEVVGSIPGAGPLLMVFK